MHFDLSDLRLFIHIAESPSLTQGARRACLSAAAASNRIKHLEAELKAQLLYRDSKGIELTDAGRRLLHHARLIMRQVDYLISEFSAFSDLSSGHMRIFANTTAVTELMPEVLATFLADHPGVTVDLQEKLTRDIIRGVLDGSTDIGIVAGPVQAPGLQILHFSTDKLVVIAPTNHDLAAQTSVNFAQTLAYQHVGLQEGSTLQAFLNNQATLAGSAVAWRIQLTSFEAICRMVAAGVGVGIIPASVARRHSQAMNLSMIALDEPWAVRERSVLIRERNALPGCARALVDTLLRLREAG